MGYGMDGATADDGTEFEVTPGTLVIHVVIGLLLALLLGYAVATKVDDSLSVMDRIRAFVGFGLPVAGFLALAVYPFSKMKPIHDKYAYQYGNGWWNLGMIFMPFMLFMLWVLWLGMAIVVALLPMMANDALEQLSGATEDLLE